MLARGSKRQLKKAFRTKNDSSEGCGRGEGVEELGGEIRHHDLRKEGHSPTDASDSRQGAVKSIARKGRHRPQGEKAGQGEKGKRKKARNQ